MNTKLIRINLLVLLGYTILAHLIALTESGGASMVIAIILMIAVIGHVGVLVLVALVNFVQGRASEGGQLLLSALLVGIIGFGTCLGSATLAEQWSGPTNFH